MLDRVGRYLNSIDFTRRGFQFLIIVTFIILVLLASLPFIKILNNSAVKTEFIIEQTAEIRNLQSSLKESQEQNKLLNQSLHNKTKMLDESTEQFNERKFDNEFQNELLIKLSNLEVIEEAYFVRNEILYWSKRAFDVGNRDEVISLEEASYQALWIYAESIENGVHPYLQTAIGVVESKLYHVTSRNHANAIGMFQLTPIVEGMYNVNGLIFEENLKGSSKFVRALDRQYNGDLNGILGHYNGGSRPYYAIEHYSETRNFVRQVKEIYESMMKKYN